MEQNIDKNTVVPSALTTLPIGPERLSELNKILRSYNAGLNKTKSRIIASENWWKLRNTMEEQKTTEIGKDNGFVSRSGWLHNVVVSKHADAMEAFPEPNILPRESGDRGEATKLSAIIPCILDQNGFEQTYSDVAWQKLKTGTGVYKVVWDSSKLNGLGDISILRANILNLYWEPQISDIQESRYFFHTELVDKDLLKQQYPELEDKLKSNTFTSAKFLYDDTLQTEDKATVIEVYYHKFVEGVKTLQYIKYVEDFVIYATENDGEMAINGLYDHALYPYVFDPLYPVEGSPCGYGYVDVCISPQTEIDLMKTAFIKNAMVGAIPRFLTTEENGINEEEFLDMSQPFVHVTGSAVDEARVRQIDHKSIDSSYIGIFDRTIQELRETSGNTETSTGNASSGVTAASAIAQLQAASGKGSKDSTMTSYRKYSQLVYLCIELIRQFYTLPRQFRIIGRYGSEQYISYTNAGLQLQHQGNDFGEDRGFRKPVFDIKITAQKKNVYTKISQNELALNFFKMGFFNPQATDQALMCLDLMDFDGKDEVMQKVSQNGTMFQKLVQYMQLSLTFAAATRPDMVEGISRDIMSTMGVSPGHMSKSAQNVSLSESDNVKGVAKKENTRVENAREQSENASQPDGGPIIAKRK